MQINIVNTIMLHASFGACLAAPSQLPVQASGAWFWSLCNSVTFGRDAYYMCVKLSLLTDPWSWLRPFEDG